MSEKKVRLQNKASLAEFAHGCNGSLVDYKPLTGSFKLSLPINPGFTYAIPHGLHVMFLLQDPNINNHMLIGGVNKLYSPGEAPEGVTFEEEE